MVVENFDDADFVGAFHGLGEFVVIDQDQLTLRSFQKITLREDADENAVLIHDRINKRGRVCGRLAHAFEQSIRREAQMFRLQHPPDPHRAAGHLHGDGRVVRRSDKDDAGRARRFLHGRSDGKISGHNDGAHPGGDGERLNIVAIADEEHESLGPQLAQPRGKSFRPHRADHEQIFRGLVRQLAAQDLAAKSIDNAGERGGDETRGVRFFARREKVMTDLESREQAEETPLSIHHRETAQPHFLEKMDGIVNRRVGVDADHVAFHHVAHPVGEIADEDGRLDPEFVEHEIDPLVGVSGPGGDHVGSAGDPLEMGIGNSRTNRIHIRIFVADDDGLHG